jgi:uncharacterized SAM-binding protein YcdF (DUF218 family)
MNASSPRRRRWWRAVGVLFLALLIYTAVMFERVRRESLRDETRAADVIVVFGAAKYAGRPSPIFRARLDQGYSLYQRGLAPMVITTGGSGGDEHYSEGGVGRDYLLSRGVPENAVIAETQSENTIRSADRVAAIMKRNGMQTCLAVSDGYHMFRIKRILAQQGITCYNAPRAELRPPTRWERARLILREVLSYTLWKLGARAVF